MTNNHNTKLLKRIKADTFINQINNKSVRKDTKNRILECFDKRVFNNISQITIAKQCNVSIATLKRFENLQVNDLVLYFNYIDLLEYLPNKIKTKYKHY